ncbi:hypothetical protein ESY86_02005 [Subsaximicrobium wynnwilliamsii]|uniref:Uncharacterized protein n=1 Tax=Subsaximicrobium wynnwilliamsii TaxID=291179 RepID=A0A5C6ZL50_9FLAO|nr:hypothetical protein [Subsaximicrobium wynnwilliamsii]TXD85406.1 hypothetical protein ESY87_00315 [Subsaximicrobium wynnwilliamsii]TXD90759.1 hypothetical protein ESY86_02005 [Subsaximicrobium wynnwilliamsii]TXE05266.1 hypothetical protein ESY88_00315 [Subsaximicrobium wynnwilliamsii]
MAPIKFEEDIKKRMEQRKIQPSEDAWEKLSHALDAEQKNKSKPLIWFMGIAASVMGVLLVSSLFFKASEGLPVRQNTVATEANESTSSISNSENESKSVKKVEQKSILQPQANVSEVTETPKATSKLNTTPTKLYTQKPVRQPSDEKLAVTKSIHQDKGAPSSTNTIQEEEYVMAVAAEIKNLETKAGMASDEEIERLLKQAEKDITKQRLQKGNTMTVSAQSLLQDVEADLDHSFRSKVFDALISSYKTVRTAVAERND